MLKQKNNSKGFTLLEMVIAMGIFIILFTLALGIYSYSLKAEQRTSQLSKLQKEAQLIMEVMAKKIRTNCIDYDYYGGTTVDQESELALLDKNNNLTVFKLENSTIAICIEGDCLLEENFSVIPASGITLSSLSFIITPSSSPFSLDNPPDEYPRITIILDLEHTQGTHTRNLLVQQTIPQRLGCF